MSEDVIGIEHDTDNPFLDEIRPLNVPVLVADARQRDVLERAGMRRASAIVVCTQDDLTNRDIALDARELKPDAKVVLRMFDSRLAEKVQRGFGIHTAFSTSELAAPIFAAAATRAQIEYSLYADDVMMNVARATVERDSGLEGRTIAQVESKLDLTVVLLRRDGHLGLHPAPDVPLSAGDQLVVLASLEGMARLREISGTQESSG